MTWPDGPRFVVRELSGYTIGKTGSTGSGAKGGVTVWVADEAYGGRAVRTWRSQEIGQRTFVSKLARMRSEAAALALELNAMSAAESAAA